MNHRCTRRTALKLMATTAAGASLPWLRSPSARAQSSDVPLRVMFIDAGNGCRRGTFEPQVPGALYLDRNAVETNWSFREVMSALDPYRDRATIFQNLDMLSGRADPSSPANAHIHGETHMLTADNRYMGSDGIGNGPSIDQLIAQQLAQNGMGTRLQSLELRGTDDGGPNRRSENYRSYSAPGQAVPFQKYIPDVWDRLFSEPLAGDSQAQAQASARRMHIHNFVRGEYDRLLGKVSPEDREKLMQMRDYRSDLFSSASVINNRDANRPVRSSVVGPWDQLDENANGSPGNPKWKTNCEGLAKLAAAALHTDSTRVVNLSFRFPPDYEYGYTPGAFGSSHSHDLDHLVSGDRPQLADPAAAEVIDESHRVMYRMVRFTLDQLASLSETDGKSLLDHTVVVVYSHIAEGSHDLTRLPWLVFGDAQGFLKTGQYVRFRGINRRNGQLIGANDTSFPYTFNGAGRPHNDLFLTVANAMGLSINSFGNPDVCTGVIDEMLA